VTQVRGLVLRRRVALVERVVEPAVEQPVLGSGLVLVVDALLAVDLTVTVAGHLGHGLLLTLGASALRGEGTTPDIPMYEQSM
jgi:hypothetical protein